MKKLLLSLAMVLGFVAAQASVVTIDPDNWTGKWTPEGTGYTATIDGVTVTTDQAQSTTKLVVPATEIRVYANSEITISTADGSAITSIVMTTATGSKAANMTYSEGWTGDASVASGADNKITVTSDGLASMTMHVGAQVRVAKIEVTINDGVEPDPVDPDPVDPDPVDPDPVDPDPAEVVTIEPANWAGKWSAEGDGFTATIDGVTITTAKGQSTTDLVQPDDKSIRVYANSEITISTADGSAITSIVMTTGASSKAANLTYSAGWTGDASVASGADKKITVTSDGLASMTMHVSAQVRIATIEVYFGGEAPGPQPVEGVTVAKTTELVTGKVAFVFNEGYVTTFAENDTYGYWYATAATVADQMVVADEAIFNLEETAEGYTLTDCYNRYMGWDGQHWSVNAYTTPDEGHCYWTAEMIDGTIKLTNTADYEGEEVYLGGKTYKTSYEMCPSHTSGDALPYLYKVDNTVGISEIVSSEDAPVVYYNLQGVQVENPAAGLYIRRQGNKTTKVLVK